MPNDHFRFKEFVIYQRKTAMKVCTDACLFGAWTARQLGDVKNILDIGTGTGLLSLMLAQKNAARIQAIEIDKDSYHEACGNIGSSSFAQQIQICEGDVRYFNFDRQFDFIITNPPFFESDLKSPENNLNLARHSTALSFTELADAINRLLKEDGKFAILLPFKEALYFKEIIFKYAFETISELKVIQKKESQPFRVFTIYGRKREGQSVTETLQIKNGEKYSDEFIFLMRDYYLDAAFNQKTSGWHNPTNS